MIKSQVEASCSGLSWLQILGFDYFESAEETNFRRVVSSREMIRSMMGGPSHWGAMELWTFWAAILGMVGFMQNLLPKEYASFFQTWVRKSVNYFIPYVLFEIPEFYGAGCNEIYDHVQASSDSFSFKLSNLRRSIISFYRTFHCISPTCITRQITSLSPQPCPRLLFVICAV